MSSSSESSEYEESPSGYSNNHEPDYELNNESGDESDPESDQDLNHGSNRKLNHGSTQNLNHKPKQKSNKKSSSKSSNSEKEESSGVSSLTTTPCSSCKTVADENKFLRQEIETLILSNSTDETGDCVGCKNLAMENIILKEKAGIGSSFSTGNIRPAFPCDDWDGVTRTCYLDRNIGDTVTFVLAFHKKANPEIQWAQEFHLYNSKKRKQYIIDPENPLWNIVIGSRGHEMRISPITEIDIDFNYFSATIIGYYAKLHKKRIGKAHPMDTVHFRIRVMPTDLGFVYPGETLMLNMKRISLPPSNMKFKWYLEKDGEYSSLPSNMRLSPTGGVLTIYELRKEQEGILACAVFTNMGFFATKQRFLIKEMNHTHNMLLFVPTRGRRKRSVESENYIVNSENSDVSDGIEDDYVTDIHIYHDKRQVNLAQNMNPQEYSNQNANQQQYPSPQNFNQQQYSPVQNQQQQQYSQPQSPVLQQLSADQTQEQQQYLSLQNTNEQRYALAQNPSQQQYSPPQSSSQQQYYPAQNQEQQQYAPPQTANDQQYAPAQNPNEQQYSPPQNTNEQQYSPAQNQDQQQYSPAQTANEQQYAPAQNPSEQQYSPPQGLAEQQYSPVQTQEQQQYAQQQYPPVQNTEQQQYYPPQNTNEQQYSPVQNPNQQQYSPSQSPVEQQYSPVQNQEQQQYSPPQNTNEQQYSPAQNMNLQQYSRTSNEQQYSPAQNANQQPYPPQPIINSQQNQPSQIISNQQYSNPQNYQQPSASQSASNQQYATPSSASGQQYSAPQNTNYQQLPNFQQEFFWQPKSVLQYQDDKNQLQPQVAQQTPPLVPQIANVREPQLQSAENIINQQNANANIPPETPLLDESEKPEQYPGQNQDLLNQQKIEKNSLQKGYQRNQQGKGSLEHKNQRHKKPFPGKGKILPKLKEKKEEIILELVRKPVTSLLQKAQDRLSRMIANCTIDQHCAADASCIQHNPRIAGFCRCSSGFQGNGIFCWEEIKVRNLFAKNQRTENDPRAFLTEEITEETTTEGKFLFKRHSHK